MVLFPDVQKKAHEELDRVVGRDRLPEFADESSMPYLSAVCKEVSKKINLNSCDLIVIIPL